MTHRRHFTIIAAAFALAACAAPRPKSAAPAREAHHAAPSQLVASAAPVAAAVPPSRIPPPAPIAAASVPKSKLLHVWGVVEKIDTAAGSLTIRDKAGRSRDFRVASDAKITRGGGNALIPATAVKPGDKVTVVHGGDVAVSIHVNVVASKENASVSAE